MIPQFTQGMFRDAWREYETDVIADAAGTYQRLSIRQAFLAGACAYRQGMASSFLNDAQDGNALANLASLDADLDALTLAYCDDARHLQVEALTGEQETDDTPMQTHLHVVEARGLTPDDVAELNDLIQGFIASKSANRSSN
jgi:hypothetical protein